MEKKKYEKPSIESREIAPGIYGNYGKSVDNTPAPVRDRPGDIFPRQD